MSSHKKNKEELQSQENTSKNHLKIYQDLVLMKRRAHCRKALHSQLERSTRPRYNKLLDLESMKSRVSNLKVSPLEQELSLKLLVKSLDQVHTSIQAKLSNQMLPILLERRESKRS